MVVVPSRTGSPSYSASVAAEGAHAAQHNNTDLVMEDLERAVAKLADAETEMEGA